MGKFRFRACLDQTLFALLIVTGVFMSALMVVPSVVHVVATAMSAHPATVATTGQAPPAPMAAASGSGATRGGTLLARLLPGRAALQSSHATR